MTERDLLVVDVERMTGAVLETVRGALAASPATDVLAFVDHGRDDLVGLVEATPSARVVDAIGLLKEAAEEGRRDAYWFAESLRATLPDAADGIGSRRFAERLSRLWWYTTLSEKNTPGDAAWWIFVRVRALRRAAGARYARAVVVSDPSTARVLADALRAEGVDVLARPVPPHRTSRPMLRRALGAVAVPVSILRARRWRTGGRCDVALFTDHPRSWTRRNGPWQDVYLADARDHVERRGNSACHAAVVFSPESGPAKWREERLARSEPTDGIEIVDGHARLLGALRRYLDPRDLLGFAVASGRKGFRQAFVQDGVDYAPLFLPLLRRSVFVAWPFLKTLEEAVSRFAREKDVAAANCYLFEQTYGRALMNGVRTGAPKAYVAGMQHGPYSRMKFQFGGIPGELRAAGRVGPLPMPDVSLVEGEAAATLVRERGVEDVAVIGAPRLDALARRAEHIRPATIHGPPWTVLVAPGLHDTEEVVSTAMRALAADERFHVVVRPHPKATLGAAGEAVEAAVRAGRASRSPPTVDLASAIEPADAVVCTYSSAGAEAVACGRPVVLLASHRVPDVSLFALCGVSPLVAVDATTMREALERLLSDPAVHAAQIADARMVVRESFHALDGRSAMRLADALTSHLGARESTSRRSSIAGGPEAPRA